MYEEIIEVDENDQEVGLRARDDFYTGRHIHRTVHLILFNSKGEILLQLRSSAKKIYPSLVTYSVDGTVANESYEECIQREVREEIGISVEVKKLFSFPFFDVSDKAWHCVFLGKSDDEIMPDPNEIQGIKWMKTEEVKEDIVKNADKYVPQFIEGMKRYFDEFYRTNG